MRDVIFRESTATVRCGENLVASLNCPDLLSAISPIHSWIGYPGANGYSTSGNSKANIGISDPQSEV